MNLKDKLHDFYEGLVDSIDGLVHDEGKTLKDAFSEAREKLSTLSELTREEIDELSDNVQQRLHELGENTNEIQEALMATAREDAQYLTSAIWEKLQRVADKTQIELRELAENLNSDSLDDTEDDNNADDSLKT